MRRLSLFLRALRVVILARGALWLRLTKHVESRIVARRGATPSSGTDVMHDLREIAWSVTAASRFIPGATCLTQALAGDWLLADRGRPARVELSLPLNVPNADFAPHAWLLSGDIIVLGGTEAEYGSHVPFREMATTQGSSR